MKKWISIMCLICLATSMVLFTGCSCESCKSDVPPDHQLASVPAVDGYTLYIPEEWQFVRSNGVITAHASSMNTIAFTAARVTPDAKYLDMGVYWQDSEAEIKALLENSPADPAQPDAEPVSSYKLENSGSGNVSGHFAYFYEYTGRFPTKLVTYRVLQYFIFLGNTPADGMIVLTLSGSDEVKETTGERDFNDAMREKLKRILDVIVIGEVTESEAATDLFVPDENAPAGMKNATLNKYLGMTVYVPVDWRVSVSDGFIGTISPDGRANIGVTNISFAGSVNVQNSLAGRLAYYGIQMVNPEQGPSLMDYWNLTKAEYNAYFDDDSFTVVSEPKIIETVKENGEKVYTSDPPPAKTGETTYYVYRFRGTHAGETYEVSLYIFRATVDRKNQFRTLTLMTREGEHDAYVSTAERILEQVKY